MTTAKIYYSNSTNPWFNLATEDWLFNEKLDTDHVLFLWQNQPTVVIGRSQNPWSECYLEKMQCDKVLLARRQSGGGAVFHDFGNTNFTFLSRKPIYDKIQNLKIITEALKTFGVTAINSGRNDLVVEKDKQFRKISGSAFKEKANRAFHHGTLLLNTDLSRLSDYLNPSKKKLEAKGVKSVRSRVMNLAELVPQINHDLMCTALQKAFLCVHQLSQHEVQRVWLDPQGLGKITTLNDYYQSMQSWDWLYGQTLEFTDRIEERFEWGTVELQLKVKNAIIEDLRIYSDSLFPDKLDIFAAEMKGQVYDSELLLKRLALL